MEVENPTNKNKLVKTIAMGGGLGAGTLVSTEGIIDTVTLLCKTKPDEKAKP